MKDTNGSLYNFYLDYSLEGISMAMKWLFIKRGTELRIFVDITAQLATLL